MMITSIVKINLHGGLCNKLFCLMSACDIARKTKIKLLEPHFGWKRKILFSDIYDLDYFNEMMKEFNNGENIMVPIHEKDKYSIQNININLWKYSENVLGEQRKTNTIMKNCAMVATMKSLRLNNSNAVISNSVDGIESKNSMHIRIEGDWIPYSKRKEKSINSDEIFLIDIHNLIQMYETKMKNESLFFTCGEKQNNIQSLFSEKNIQCEYIFDKDLEYEINAAINFDICCRSKQFIGLTRSTFSNLITLKRHLTNKDESYIYNYKKEILLRNDAGLHPSPSNAIEQFISIT